jgi:uncharacterized membrane protein
MRKHDNRRQFFRSLEAESLSKRPFLTQIADQLTSWCGSPAFLVLNAVFFVVWIPINLGLIPSIEPFDPFPFGLLTMAVSLEAIFLSIFVLISQNRSSYITTLRDEVQLQVGLIAEKEITKILQILHEMRQQMGIKTEDKELAKMIQKINEMRIEEDIQSQITAANNNLLVQLSKDLPSFVGHAVKSPVDIIRSLNGEKDAKKSN